MPETAIATGPSTRPRFSLVVQSYFWLVFGFLGLSPICIVYSIANRNPVSPAWWITRSTITGWMTISFFTVTPALLAAFLGSIWIAIYGDLQRRPDYAPAKWAQIVSFFYRNRMRR